jgi:hypothetical protein
MAYTLLALQTTARAGITPTYGAALAAGHAFDNSGGNVILHVKNAGGSPITVTIGGTKTVDGRTLPALTVSVPATSGDKIIGPFPKDLYNAANADTSLAEAITVDYSAVTSLTIAAFKIGSVAY